MRISDWSSDVCSSDLSRPAVEQRAAQIGGDGIVGEGTMRPCVDVDPRRRGRVHRAGAHDARRHASVGRIGDRRPTDDRALGDDRKSVEWGKRVSVRVDLGGRRIIKKKQSISLYKRTTYNLLLFT